jgi:hypothetical protein
MNRKGSRMTHYQIKTTVLVSSLLAGGLFFFWMVVLSDAVPTEYRSTSPGFGWSWDFNYDMAMQDAGRLGEAPWPWPAEETGNRLVLPIGQPLLTKGMELTYQGRLGADRFRLDVIIQSLDSSFTYPRDFSVLEARRGFTIHNRSFTLDKISPLYISLRSTVS